MNTRTMLARENFIQVLLDTVTAYYRQVHGAEVELSFKKSKGAKVLYLYYMPMFLSSFPLSKGAKKFLYSEYNIRGNLIKYVIGKLGVFAITNSFGIGAAKKIYIRSQTAVNTRLFISPCNRTIRFYDFEADKVDCILKAGYQPLFLNNQLDFRMNCDYEFVPKVLTRGENWYSERIMHGHALARVRDAAIHAQSLTTVEDYVSMLAGDTLDYVPASAYLRQMRSEFVSLCNDLLGPQNRQVQVASSHLDRMETQLADQEMKVPTCISHGDLQEGNIWVTDDGKVLIYDWETCGRRSVWYDPATLHYSLHNRSENYDLPGRLRGDEAWLRNDPCKAYTAEQIVMIACILSMEDILFQLREALQLTQPYCQNRAKEVLTAFAETMEGMDYGAKT